MTRNNDEQQQNDEQLSDDQQHTIEYCWIACGSRLCYRNPYTAGQSMSMMMDIRDLPKEYPFTDTFEENGCNFYNKRILSKSFTVTNQYFFIPKIPLLSLSHKRNRKFLFVCSFFRNFKTVSWKERDLV